MIVNNAGSVAGGSYFQIDPQMLVDDANVDLVALFVINRILMPKLRTRRHRSAILNICSCTGVYLSPYVGVYSCTKRSLNIYSQIL
jgi:short-subunit dehydrogenase